MGESIREAIETIITSIRPQMNETHWEELEKYAQQLCTSNLTSLNEYMNLREGFNVLQKSLGQISTELELSMSQNDTPNNQDENENLYPCIIQLKGLFDVLQQQQTDEYVRSLLNDADKLRSQLFGGILHTKYIINTHYRLLAKLFHPDSVAGSELVTIFTELFQRIGQEKDIILNNLKERTYNHGEVAYYENEGNLEWKIAQDYKNATKPNYNFKLLSKESIENWSSDQLEKAKKQHALVAFEYYHSAALALRKSANLKDVVRLHKNLALCLILAGQILEAEMYALGTIYIILNESDSIAENIPHLKEMEEILKRIRNIADTNTNQASASTQDSLTETTTALVKTETRFTDIVTRNPTITNGQRRKLQSEINDLIYDCILRGNTQIVQHVTPSERITEIRLKAEVYKHVGASAIVGGLAGGAAVTGAGLFEVGMVLTPILTTSAVISSTIFFPITLTIGGISAIVLGVMSGRKLYKKGILLRQEPKIRENLNKIMEEALNHFENNDYENFFETLAKQYDDGTKQLIKFVPKKTIEIQPKDVVEQLLLHEFRPDGIAYLLNMIGEALVRRKIMFERDSQAELNVLAIKLFRAIYEESVPQENVQKKDEFDPATKLTEEANKLDNIVSITKQKHRNTILDKIKRSWVKNYHSIPKKYFEDAKKGSFTDRLEEIRNIARINCATCHIIMHNDEQAKRILEDVKASFDETFDFFGRPDLRIKALEDWLFALDVTLEYETE